MPVNPVTVGALVYADDMDALQPGVLTCYHDHADLNSCTNTGNSGDFTEAQCYRPGNVTFTGGVAYLTARAETATCEGLAKNYTSGMLDFHNTPAGQLTYGYYEARIQVPAEAGYNSVGLWSAFWNVPSEQAVWPPEADTFEFFGGSSTGSTGAMLVGADGKLHPQRFTATYHLPDRTQTSTDFYGLGGPGSTDWSAGWHVWGLDVRPGLIRVFVDGVLVKSVARDWPADVLATKPSAATTASFPIVNLALRDKYATWLPAELPQSVKVDYLRVWN